MGKLFREMTRDDRARDMEEVGCNRSDRADRTVSGSGSDDSWNDNGDRVSGGSAGGGYARRGDTGGGGKRGPGFPSRPWGED